MADAKALKRQKFENVFNVIRDELLSHFASLGMPTDATEWYHRVRYALSNLSQFSNRSIDIELELQRSGWKVE